MPTVTLDGDRIADWHAFHAECEAAFGFPDFYGANMDAWIDCMSGLRDGDGMTKFTLGPDEILDIKLLRADALRRQAPEILQALRACTEEVNERCVENGEKPVLKLELR